MLITIISFVVIFSLLVLVHEWGHFAAARKAGIKVEEFGIGLPPKLKSIYKDKKGTIYSLNWIPFGGFVRLFGEDSSDPKILKDKKSFASKTLWQRTTVIVAGVVMNFILAWVLITIGFLQGMQPFLATQADIERGISNNTIEAEPSFYVHEVLEGSPSYGSDLKVGSYLIAINGQSVNEDLVLSEIIKPNQEVQLTYSNGEKTNKLTIKSDENGKLGLKLSYQNRITKINEIKYPIHIAPLKALKEVGRLSYLTVSMLGNVISNLVNDFSVPDGIAGPVGIFKLTGKYAQEGIMALIQFTALLSISLGVINIMPFPALDGGRFLFIIYEVITRKKPNAKWEAIIHTIGFAILMLFILIITFNDILNISG